MEQDHIDSINEFIQYKNDSDTKLIEHEFNIANLKNKVIESRSDYELQLDNLDQINAKLKFRIHEYKEKSREAWETFKHSFNQDIDELGKSISLMAEHNKQEKPN